MCWESCMGYWFGYWIRRGKGEVGMIRVVKMMVCIGSVVVLEVGMGILFWVG